MRIAIVGMLCEPSGASEGSVSWKWARGYSDLGHEVVLYTSHSQRRFFNEQDLQELRVIFVGAETGSDKSPHSTKQAFRLFQQMRKWNKSIASEIDSLRDFDLVQQVSLSTVRVRSSLGDLGEILVWGPLGGAHIGRTQGVSGSALIFEIVRNVSVWISLCIGWASGWFRSFKGTILVTNNETLHHARRLGARNVALELSDGLTESWLEKPSRPEPGSQLSIVWAGRLVGSKRPDLAVKVLHALRTQGTDARLTFYGEGPERDRLEKLALSLGVRDHVDLAGFQDPRLMPQLLGEANVCLFTSFRDSSSPLLLEALGLGVPCAAVRIQGVAACFPERLVPGPAALRPEHQLVLELAESVRIATSASSSQDRMNFARTHLWSEKASRVVQLHLTNIERTATDKAVRL